MSVTKLCGNYAPAVTATLVFLLSEMQKRKEALQREKPYKKHQLKKITYNNIDEIMSCAFGPAPRFMGDIRRCYLNSEKSEKIQLIKNSSWNFNAKLLKEKCTDFQIDISKNIDQIQKIFISTLSIEEVLSKDDNLITANIKNQIRQDIQTLSSVLEKKYGIQYWKIILKYFSKCTASQYVMDLMVLLPQCKKEFIDNWKRQLEKAPSSLYRRQRYALENYYSYLQDYSKELLTINKGQVGTPHTWEEILHLLTTEELFCAIHYIHLIQAISEHKLSADDLDIIYLVITQLSNNEKWLFYNELSDELNLDVTIAF